MAEQGETIRTIFQKFWFLIVPAKGLGLLPWRIHRHRLTREGLFGRICCIFLVVVSSLLTIKKTSRLIQGYVRRDLVKIFTPRLVLVLTLAGQFLVVITDVYREFTNAQTGLKIIQSLALYDRRVKQLGLARKDKFLFTWIMTLSIIASLLASSITLLRPRDLTILKFFYNLGPFIINLAYHLACLKFCIILHLLYQRYKHLNEIVLPKDEWRIRGNLAVNRRFVNMHDLAYLLSTLTTATEVLAEVYSFELFVWVSSPIWEFLVALWHVQTRYFYGIQGFTEIPSVLITFWRLCWMCPRTAQEANKFALQILRTDPELIHAIDIDEQLDVAIYLYNHKISIRAWKFYEVNLSTLLYIASLTASLGTIIFDGEHGVANFRQSFHHA